MSKLGEDQIEYGRSLVWDYAVAHNISYQKAVQILLDTKEFKDIWEWVNCDIFLNEEL